ncbi:Predicted arabinose efflux permease, MFS family [Mucilaginibacter pineti]|uniref:Predicted arabinose efflux permease, MFS family n=1 Tax=Mucilaginibacter pineti TaxID=1391627 RepID=A0A1G6X7Q9_9SPHI|nr:MFS transporter [Mucilaginibacter pineti]SDD73365.1 Predicted arabinose efflux permease, MFS family [Mucilaginibacter pineti]
MPSTQTKPTLFPILLVNFIDALGFSVVIPFLVVIVIKLGGHELVYGFLSATYSFFQLIGAPILGNWSDKFGRKKILLISEAGTFIAWLIFLVGLVIPNHQLKINTGFAGNILFSLPLLMIFLGRALDGLTGGNISVANAYVADISVKDDRKRNFGKMAAASNLGLIFGPLLAGLLGATALGNILPVVVTAFISLVALSVIYFKVQDRAAKPVSKATPGIIPTKQTTFKGLKSVLKLPYVPYFLILYFLIFLGFNFFYVGFPVYAAGQLHWSVLQLGIFFSFLSGMMVLMEGPVMGYLSKRISGAALVIAGSTILCGCFVLLRFDSIVYIYAGALLFAIGNGIMWPSFIALLSNTGTEHVQGMIQGFASSAGSLASIIGLISGAFLYHTLGANLFLLTAGFMLLIAFLAVPLIKIEKKM